MHDTVTSHRQHSMHDTDRNHSNMLEVAQFIKGCFAKLSPISALGIYEWVDHTPVN